MTDLPPPPVTADLDLRDFRWMKLDLIALFNSDFNATPDDTAWRAGVTLWGKAWHQVPAGSLPTDDATLCNLAGLGRDLRTWRRIRDAALRGFALHADGRLYHSYLCEMAVGADEEKRRYAERRAKDRERKKAGNSVGGAAGIPQEKPDPSAETRQENLIEGEGEGEKKERQPAAPAEYAFIGRVARLNVEDFKRWQMAYRNLDLVPQLTSRDDWLSSDEATDQDRKKWFLTTSKLFARLDAEAAAKGLTPKAAQKPRPQADDWAKDLDLG